MSRCKKENGDITDFGPNPLIVNMNSVANENSNFRTSLWTGRHLQVTLMSIPPGGEIGVEMHSNLDQLLYIESGMASVMMGENKTSLDYKKRVNRGFAVVVPAGTWHNVINTGRAPLKLYSVYAPPQHPFKTVHKTKADADKAD